MFRQFLVLSVVPLAIPESEVTNIILTLTGLDASAHAIARAEYVAKEAKQKEEQRARWDADKAERIAKQKALAERVHTDFVPQIAHLNECNVITAGILVKVVTSAASYANNYIETVQFLYVRTSGRGSFGRTKWQKAYSATFTTDFDGLVWKDQKQENDFSKFTGFRLASLQTLRRAS